MSEFLDELKRRGVMRAAALYAVVAWAIIESSATILPMLGIPEWTVKVIVVAALVGFPIALIAAWVFDFTRQGIVRTANREQVDAAELRGVGRGRAFEFVIIAVLGVAVVWLGWDRLQQEELVAQAPAPAQVLDSIAVLPFANLSGDPENEYFGDGLAEELLNVLVKIDGLRVTARTSSFQYRGQNLDIRKIGAALGVATILEGSVRKFGERVRVTAQLIRADDGFHLWSETFDRDLADIFAVQDEISLAIAEALRGTFGGAATIPGPATAHPRQTINVAAFEAYLRGRFAMNKRTPESLDQAVIDFREAISLDPNYAAAFSGLSDTYMLQNSYAGLDNAEALRLAEPLMQRAITLDSNLAEAQASRGFVLGDKGDSEGAIAAFRRAIELNPSYSPAHHWLALKLQNAAKFEEAKQALVAGVEVDPGYATGKRVLLGLLRNMGNHDQADALALSMAQAHADDSLVLNTLSEDALMRNRVVDGVNYAAQAVELQPDSPVARMTLAIALGKAGDMQRADEQVEIARLSAPDNPKLAFWPWPLYRAHFAGEFGKLDQLRAGVAAEASKMHGWDENNCNFAVYGSDPDSIIEACGGILERAQWQAGQPLPQSLRENVGALYSVYLDRGMDDAAAELGDAIDAQLDQLEASGMSKRMIDFYRTHMAMAQGDTEPLLAILPSWIQTNLVTAASLEHELSWEPVREDPRFQQLIADTHAREAEVLALVKAIELP